MGFGARLGGVDGVEKQIRGGKWGREADWGGGGQIGGDGVGW